MSEYGQQFRDEARALLIDLESSLLELQSVPSDMESVKRVFRILHAISRAAMMYDFEPIAAFAGEIAQVFDLARNGRLGVTRELAGLTLVAGDRIRIMLNDNSAMDDVGFAVIKRMRGLRVCAMSQQGSCPVAMATAV